MIHYRKIGGIHWFAIGRLRFTFMIVKPKDVPTLPYATSFEEYCAREEAKAASAAQSLKTWTKDEHNRFIF